MLFNLECSEEFLRTLYKQIRKRGGLPTGITQNVEDLLRSYSARTMLANSEFIQMLSQSQTDRIELAELLNLSETQISYVTNADAGSGLIYYGGAIIPFKDKFPNDTKLYKLMSTNFNEVDKQVETIKKLE